MTTYPVSVLRAVALRAQNLHITNDGEITPTKDSLFDIINQIGCVQIDTLHMVRRSQYLIPWSRMGTYNPSDFDNLIFGSDRRLFEGLEHAATIIPLREYRYQMPRQRDLREHPSTGLNLWLNELVQKDFLPHVLERIRLDGALKVSNFESDGPRGGTWWSWRPAKVALEYLYALGELMIADRIKFQRVYDLTGRVLPKWVDMNEPTIEERDRFWVERGAKALGVCLPRHAGDYTWMKVSKSLPIVEALIQDGVIRLIKGKMENGKVTELIIHRDNLPILEQAADGTLKAERTTFLSPFDNLFWATRRDELLWGFHQSLECYLPAPKRVYGYFCLPILHQDRLIGRLDPKLERKTSTLILRALYLEPGVKVGDELVRAVAGAMRDFMVFHEAKDLVIEYSEPAVFGKKLLRGI